MKRRFFFSLFSGSFVLPSFLKWSDLDRDTSVVSSGTGRLSSQLSSKETVVNLKPGQQYTLPEQPEHLKTIVFINEGEDWSVNPPVIKAETSLLAGKGEPILVDQNMNFGLRYLGKKTGWTLVNV